MTPVHRTGVECEKSHRAYRRGHSGARSLQSTLTRWFNEGGSLAPLTAWERWNIRNVAPLRDRTSHSPLLAQPAGVALACVLLLCQLSATAHLLLVRHSVCAEHGELI